MYPRDAITVSFTTKTAGTYTLLPASTTPYTLLSGTMSGTGNGGDEQGFILGSSSIWLKGDVAQQVSMHLVYTNRALQVRKFGNASTTFGITYVPRDRRNTFDPQLSQSSTTVTLGSSTMTTTDYSHISFISVAVFFALYIFGYWLVRKFL